VFEKQTCGCINFRQRDGQVRPIQGCDEGRLCIGAPRRDVYPSLRYAPLPEAEEIDLLDKLGSLVAKGHALEWVKKALHG